MFYKNLELRKIDFESGVKYNGGVGLLQIKDTFCLSFTGLISALKIL